MTPTACVAQPTEMVGTVKPAKTFDEEEWLPDAKGMREAGEPQKRKRKVATPQKPPRKPVPAQKKQTKESLLPTDDDLSDIPGVPNPSKKAKTTDTYEAERCVALKPSCTTTFH
jgi:hypothetical protein